METVTERLLHEERKVRDREGTRPAKLKAMTVQGQKRKFTCGRPGHFRRNCRKLAADKEKGKLGTKEKQKHKANKAVIQKGDESSSSSDNHALVAFHALSATSTGNWIVDSGATCHMCNNAKMFAKFKSFKKAQDVTLGDRHVLEATGEGIVQVKMKIVGGVICGKSCSYQTSHTTFSAYRKQQRLEIQPSSMNVVVKYSPMMGCGSKKSWKSLLPGM